MATMVPRRVQSRPRAVLAPAVLAVALLAGCGGPSPEPTSGAAPGPASVATPDPVAASRPVRIAFLGDSLAAGYGLSGDDAFPALVERTLREQGRPVDVLNAGVSGDTSAGGLARIDWILRSRPDVVVVELGANDALRGQPLAGTERNLRAIVERARAAGARVVLLGMDVPTNYGPDYAGAFSALYPRIADDLDVAFVPGFVREVGLDPVLIQPDGLHPTAEGHRRLAAMLVPFLRPLVDEVDKAG